MEKAKAVKTTTLSIIGIVGSAIANALGGWDMALQTLVLFMTVDYALGLIVAGVFKKSGKSETGALESHAGWKGLCKKGVILLLVLVASQLDRLTGTDFVRDAVVIGFVANETLSIFENVGLMGVPIPPVLKNAIEILKEKSEGEIK